MMSEPMFLSDNNSSPLTEVIERFFVRHRKYISWVHAAMFVFFTLTIAVPLFLPDPPENASMLNNFSVFSKELIWTIWFPLVFVSVLISGRSWCGLLCPIGAASEWVNKRGVKNTVPRWVEWQGTPIVSFLVVTIWGQLIGVRDHPEGIAWVFGVTMLAALLTGFLWGYHKRVWCRHLCPIGLMLGIFSRLGVMTFTPKRPRIGAEQVTDKTACPTRIALPYKTESRHCISCFRCVSPCAKGGLSLEFRPAGQEIAEIGKRNPNLAEVIFLFLGTGIALGGFMWTALPSYQLLRQFVGRFILEHNWLWMLETGPTWLVSVHPERREVFLWMDAFLIGTYMLCWMIMVALLMAAITYVITYATKSASHGTNFRQRYIEIGYHLIPVAMTSLLIGLGNNLFYILEVELLGKVITNIVKTVLVVGSVLWGVALCRQVLAAQGIRTSKPVLVICFIGNLLVASCWLPAIF